MTPTAKTLFFMMLLLIIITPRDVEKRDKEPVATPTADIVMPTPDPRGTPDYFIWPLPMSCTVLRPYRMVEGEPNGYFPGQHNGWDIDCPEDTPVLAVTYGEVTDIYGRPGNLTIHVARGNLRVVYAHIKTSPDLGHFLGMGDHIGPLGTHSGSHLHIEIWRDGSHLDPANWLPEVWTVRDPQPIDGGLKMEE